MAELIKEFRGCTQPCMLLQGDGGNDCNCTTLRILVASSMIMVGLELELLVLMKNAVGSSVHNPVEKNIGSCDFGIQNLNCTRLDSTNKVEDKPKQAKSIKQFVVRNSYDKGLMKDYLDSVQPVIDEINNTKRESEHDNRKMLIGDNA